MYFYIRTLAFSGASSDSPVTDTEFPSCEGEGRRAPTLKVEVSIHYLAKPFPENFIQM